MNTRNARRSMGMRQDEQGIALLAVLMVVFC